MREPNDCLNRIGVQGDGSCPELQKYIHCRNCPEFESLGRHLLDREPPADYLREQTALLALEKPHAPWVETAANIFRLGPEWLALPAGLFVEIVSLRPVRRVPHRTNEILLGLASVRGEIHLCCSLARLLDLEETAGITPAPARRGIPRFMVLRWKRATWIFPADEVHGLRRYRQEELRAVPATVAKAKPKFTTALLPFAEQEAGLLDAEALFSTLERSIR